MRMRVLVAIAAFLFAVAGHVPARAADLPDEHAARNVFTHRVPAGHRVGPIVVYDYQPGVVVRAYWASPWRHRHYFPFGKQEVEDRPGDDDGAPAPAESFERHWSTCDICGRDLPPLRARDEIPRDEQLPVPKK